MALAALLKEKGYYQKFQPQRAQRKTLCSQKEFPLKAIAEQIISCAIAVHKTLGPGFLESVYEEALVCEFELREILYARQKEIGEHSGGKNNNLLVH